MNRNRTLYAFVALMLSGCEFSRPVTGTLLESERNVTVSSGDSFIEHEDGTRIPVDGVPDGQTIYLKESRLIDWEGRVLIDLDVVPENGAQ